MKKYKVTITYIYGFDVEAESELLAIRTAIVSLATGEEYADRYNSSYKAEEIPTEQETEVPPG